ncbi:MAG: 50S ribosomal protein L10 [Patescibacteria group bacterium]
MVKQAKLYAVEDLVEKFKSAKSSALVDYQGLTAEQITALRREVTESGGQMLVIKNTLISRALAKIGISLDQTLTGPTAVVFSNQDELASLKTIDETSKKLEKPEFKLGVLDNKLILADGLKKLVNLPSKEVLLAQFVGGLANPLVRLVLALKFNQSKLVMVLQAVADKGGENNG